MSLKTLPYLQAQKGIRPFHGDLLMTQLLQTL